MKKTARFLFSVFSISFALSLFGFRAQGQILPDSPKAKIRVESVTLCPGQTADVAVYVDFGEYATREGVRAMENFMFFLYLSDTSVCEIVSSYKRRTTGTGYGGKVYDYWVCEPVLKDMHPNIKCCMQNSYIYGKGWEESDYVTKNPKAGRFASTWFASESWAFMLTDSIPLFRIRIRCKKEGECKLDFCGYDQMAFSTGLTFEGGRYFDFRNGITNGVVDAKPGKGPDKSLVNAGHDSVLCVGSRFTLNGEGGTDYQWTEISGKGAQQSQFLAGSKTKNPTFTPKQAGTYKFQMAAYASNGCSTLDTVVYTVGANNLSGVSISPDWNFIDPGSSMIFKVEAETPASSYPLSVTFAPDSLFAEDQNVFDMTHGEPLYVASMPVSEPNLVAATFEDKYGCKAEVSSSVFIKGQHISGYLNPFPVYRCGNDNSDKSIQLNVLTKGGSGRFNYKWTATDLEGNVAAPVIDDPIARSPRLTYQGLCAISVSIYDLVTGENVVISDTMIYRDWLHPSVEVVVDTVASGLEPGAPVGPFCEGKELVFKLNTLHAGDAPVFNWRINGITQEDATGETFSAVLDRDDSIDVVMYSTEECVAEQTVQSPLFGINVRYPVYMSASVVNSSDLGEDYLEPCYDSVKYRVLTWNAGEDYTITWWRNNKDMIYEKRVHVDSAMGTEEHSEVDVVLPRVGFYDNYACAISKSSMPCAIFDSITTESAYLNEAYSADDEPQYVFHMSFDAELLPIQTRFAHQAACESDSIVVTTDIRNLPRDFVMIWFKKPMGGGDSVFLGYYRYDIEDEINNFSNNSYVPAEFQGTNRGNAIFDLVKVLNYPTKGSMGNALNKMEQIREVMAGGFRLVLNKNGLKGNGNVPATQLQAGSFEAGDTLFYVLYTPQDDCGTELRRYRSENFVPNLIENRDYSDKPLQLAKQGPGLNCPTAPMVVVASIPNLPDDIKPLVRYEWRYDGRFPIDNRSFYLNPLLESDIFPDYFVKGAQKDTLYVTHSPSDVKITCRAILDLSCGIWGSNKYKSFNFAEHVSVGKPNFSLAHTETDTIVCVGDEVTLWAKAYEKNKSYKNKRKAAKAAAEYEYAWSTSWETLPKEGANIGAGGSVPGMTASGEFSVKPNPAVVPQGYFEDWNGVDGLTTYYLSVHHKSADCWSYDSVQLFTAPDKQWNVSLNFTKQGMWCDSILSGPQAQKIYLTSNDDPHVAYSWYLNGNRQFGWKGDTICVAGMLSSDTIQVSVFSDLITCQAYNQVVKMGIPYHESPMDVLTLADPEWAKAGDDVVLYAGAVYKGTEGYRVQDYVLNATYRWEKQEKNGSWTAVPASAHGIGDKEYNTDTMSVVVADYMPHYRVIAEGPQHLCPADTGFVEIPVAVPTHVGLDVVDVVDEAPIFGMCSQTNDYVKIIGTQGNTGTVKDTLFDVVQGNRVRVRAFAQNPGAESWVMYYLNGKAYAAGPVGSARPNPRLPEPGSVSYDILTDGTYCDMALKEGDVVYVMYSTDTTSDDGLYTHYSSRYEMWRLEPNGQLQLVSDDQVVCPGSEVDLEAYFEDEEETYGHIDKNQELGWAPAAALKGSPKGWEAVGVPTQETVYKANAVDGMNCPWTDSLRIYPMKAGEALSVPFKLASSDSVFCGDEVQTALLAYLPGNNKHLSNTYSEITYYVCDASGAKQDSVKGFDQIQLPMAVKNGWTAYATAKFKATCNTALSYSDTVVFRSLAHPVIERVLPRSADTSVCASHALEMKYLQPEGCGFAWHSVLAPMWGSETSLNRAYRVDRNTQVVFEAYRTDLLSCRSFDTVEVSALSGGLSGGLSLSLKASAGASCGEKDSVTYTLTKRNCDTIIWYVNGVEAARDVLSLTILPRLSGLTGAPDTVQVYGARAANVCADYANAWSNAVVTRRVEKPVITYITPDTTVEKGATLELRVSATVRDGEPASFVWVKGEDEEVSEAASFSFEVTEPAIYRVMAYQEPALKLSDVCWSEAMVKVSMITEGGDPVGPLPLLPDLSLSVSDAWLCGEGEVTYTLSVVAGYDTLVWYENGLEIARDVMQLQRTPDYTGFGRADTVFVRGVAVDSLRPAVDTIRYRNSNIATVHRIERPVFVSVSPRDTLVEAQSEVTLTALATAPDGPEIVYYWSDSMGDETGEGATFVAAPEQTRHYYVLAEQYSTNTFECFAEDSVLVRVMVDTTILMGEIEIYIPNTVIPYSNTLNPYTHKNENIFLRVYGQRIKHVHLQVFNERSEKVYEGEGDAESTRWDATGTDGKQVPAGTYSYKATVTVLDAKGEEHILNQQSWVQVIL